MTYLTKDGGGTKSKKFRKSYIVELFDKDTDVVVGFEYEFRVPEIIGTANLVEPNAKVITAGVTGSTDISVFKDGSTDMLTADISIASTTTAGSGTVNGSNAGVTEGTLIKLTVESVSTTAPKGLFVELIFEIT